MKGTVYPLAISFPYNDNNNQECFSGDSKVYPVVKSQQIKNKATASHYSVCHSDISYYHPTLTVQLAAHPLFRL